MFTWKKTKTTIEITIEENTKVFLEDFKNLVRNNDIITISNLIKFMANSVQGELLTKCLYNDRNYKEYIRHITHSLLLDLPFENYQTYKVKVDISRTPIISCIWNHSRMIDSLMHIGVCTKNPFDGVTHAGNIHATLFKPLGLVIVEGGNHSVNSAIVHNEGEIIVDTVVDITPVLEKYYFNGKEYIDITTNIRINDKFLKNDSQPFTYILGLLFEMGRVLNEYSVNLKY